MSAQRSPYFVKFLGYFENTNTIYIAMEYIEYGNLADYINKPIRGVTERIMEAEVITSQILWGLVELHGRGICHRDLKPNVSTIGAPSVNRTDSSLEYYDRISLAVMGQDNGSWSRKVYAGNKFANQNWYTELYGPRAYGNTSQSVKKRKRVPNGSGFMVLGCCCARDVVSRDTVSRHIPGFFRPGLIVRYLWCRRNGSVVPLRLLSRCF